MKLLLIIVAIYLSIGLFISIAIALFLASDTGKEFLNEEWEKKVASMSDYSKECINSVSQKEFNHWVNIGFLQAFLLEVVAWPFIGTIYRR